MAPRKTAATVPTDAPVEAPDRDALLASVLTRMGACDTHAAAGRSIGVAETRLKTFRQNMRDNGTFRSRGDATDAAAYASAYAERPFIRRAVDAHVDALIADASIG